MRNVKYLALLVLLYNTTFLFEKIFIEMVNPNYIYEDIGLSQNYPGILLILWSCFWGFCKYLTERKVSVIVPILSCFLAFFLKGRSSLGILLFLSVMSLCLRNKKYVHILLLIGSGLIYMYWDVVLDIYLMTNFAEYSLGSSRYNIWRAYFEALDFISLLGGLELSNVPLIHSYGNNPHNFLLNFHYRMGFLGVIALVSLAILSIKKYINKNDYIPLLYLVCVIIRFMFDACINSTYDFILYAMLFYPFLNKNKYDFSLSQLDTKGNLLTRIFSIV